MQTPNLDLFVIFCSDTGKYWFSGFDVYALLLNVTGNFMASIILSTHVTLSKALDGEHILHKLQIEILFKKIL